MIINKSVIEYKQYGKISIHLAEIMDKRNINRYTMSKLTGIRYEVINKWYNNNVERVDLDVLAKLCYTLNCSVSDIMEYICD